MPRFCAILLLALACTGCLRSTTTIELKTDGTGTIVQETGMSAQTIAMLKGFGGAEAQTGASSQIFGEEQAKKAAAAMGARFVSGEPMKTGEFEGYRANYAFDDVSQLKLDMKDAATTVLPGADVAAKTPAEPPLSFGFAKGAGSSVLTINVPQQTNPLGELPGMGDQKAADALSDPKAMAMVQMMMRGMFVDVGLVVDGTIVKTNANNVDGSRITLMQLDFDKLVADPTALKRLQGMTDMKSVQNIPGLKALAEPKVTVEFAR